MFIIDGRVHWSASDLTAAASCEYATARTLDYKLRRATPIPVTADPLQDHIARLGDRHEAALLAELSLGELIALDRVPAPYTVAALEAAREETRKAFAAQPATVYQAAFFDGEFFGYADFVERTESGWLVCDAKLARSAKPRALLQLGAYAEQIERLDLPLAKTVALLLGNGERVDFPVVDVLPVFRERRTRLRGLLTAHEASAPVAWGDGRYVACGRCDECAWAAGQSQDVIGVAGVRMSQRQILRDAGIITIADLASATARPDGMATSTFTKLRRQAALQNKQLQGGDGAPVEYELIETAGTTLSLLPAPSAGDLFFDFEGDPLYDEGDPSSVGLEYLWGVMDAAGDYTPLWAHTSADERTAFVEFMDLVADRRRHYPDLHVYHYAPYETSALKRLAMRYQTREKDLDDLLRSEVFVDLYATVRGSVMISRSSYSIKKLEPLYMGDQLRAEDGVQAGGDSILAYHEAREFRATEPARAQALLDDLEAYNTYDCLSTLRLRDWLLERATEAGVRDRITAQAKDVQGEELSEQDPVFIALMGRSGPEQRALRSPEQQTYAMLATSLDYYRRERKKFWWEHFDRLLQPAEEWSSSRDVFLVESVALDQDWAVPEGRSTNARRVLRLTGDWSGGSKVGSAAHVVYRQPAPPAAEGPDRAPHGAAEAERIEADDTDPRVVRLTEARNPADTFADLPLALTPAAPPNSKAMEAAIAVVAARAAAAPDLPRTAALDVLTRRAPRLRGGGALPLGGSAVENVIAALIAMDDSYVALQGPPGSGKTWSGSRVIKELVERHHWRVGVVAQSHAVVENMLDGVIRAGVDPELVGKNDNERAAPTWTVLKAGVPPRAKFLADHAQTGGVLGGTVWTFANSNLIEAAGLDLLVIDEAGQFSLAPTIAASVSAKRLLLLGDPQQLPQVSQGTHAEPVDESALGWLMGRQAVLDPTLGYFLDMSYRMHPALCAKVSELSYAGQLCSAPAAAARDLAGVRPGLEVVNVEHTGNRTESPEEAAEVLAQVRAHLGAIWTDPDDLSTPRPLAPHDVLVVAPYNAQVAKIRRVLDAAGLNEVRVGTVDKFQGQEAPIAIVSMTASSHGDVPRGMGFLLSRNRLNVGVSRAQWKAILIRSEALTSFMPSSVDGVLQLGAFIGLCTDPEDVGR